MNGWAQVLTIAAGIVVIGTAITFIARWLGSFWAVVAKLTQFLDDWNGEPAREGISPGRPGVLARLARVEALDERLERLETMVPRLERLEAIAETLEHEVKANMGASLKDQISRIEEHTVPPEARPT